MIAGMDRLMQRQQGAFEQLGGKGGGYRFRLAPWLTHYGMLWLVENAWLDASDTYTDCRSCSVTGPHSDCKIQGSSNPEWWTAKTKEVALTHREN